MQLKRDTDSDSPDEENNTPNPYSEGVALRTALAAATCSLLGIAPSVATAAPPDATQVDSAFLYYNEKDRITVNEAGAMLTVPLGVEETLTVTPVIDTITGASPNGAAPSNVAQTFGGTTTPAGELPVQHFSDRRYAVSLEWQYPTDRMSRTSLGADLSAEQDYGSISVNLTRMRDFNNKLTTLTAGISGSRDTITPASGVFPSGLSSLGTSSGLGGVSVASSVATVDAVTQTSGGGTTGSFEDEEKQVKEKLSLGGLLGLTQVLNRRILMQFNYSLGISSGYLTDPYKIISTVDGNTGDTIDYLSEKRPDFRLKQTFYWKTVLHLPEDVVHFSYRYYQDDWGIKSHTAELNYHLKFGKSGFYLEPQVRYYEQTAADFYRHSLIDGADLPDYASADYRLAEMSSYTYSLKVAASTGKDGELSARFMTMQQTGNSHPVDAVGLQQNLDLYPGLNATALQLSWNFKF